MPELDRKPSNANSRRLAGVALAAFIVLMAAACWFVGRPLIDFVNQPEKFRAWVDENGIWSRLGFIGMMVVQIFIAIIPGEPLEIGAGYAFGAVEGTLLCILGAVLGSTIVFLMVRRFGVRLVEIFFPKKQIQDLKFMKKVRNPDALAFLLMLIPGTPKDLFAYFMGLTPMKLTTWMLINATARIPSIITSTIGGNALGTRSYLFAGIMLVITLLISIVGIYIYKGLSNKETPPQS